MRFLGIMLLLWMVSANNHRSERGTSLSPDSYRGCSKCDWAKYNRRYGIVQRSKIERPSQKARIQGSSQQGKEADQRNHEQNSQRNDGDERRYRQYANWMKAYNLPADVVRVTASMDRKHIIEQGRWITGEEKRLQNQPKSIRWERLSLRKDLRNQAIEGHSSIFPIEEPKMTRDGKQNAEKSCGKSVEMGASITCD